MKYTRIRDFNFPPLNSYVNNSIYTIICSHKYSSLTDLVEACKKNEQRGLACLLTEVCIKPRSSNEIADGGGKWDIPRSYLKKEKELGRGNFGVEYKGGSYDHCEEHLLNS